MLQCPFCNEILKRGISHPWTAFARVDTVSLELLQAMKDAGCVSLCFGIESGDQEILNTIKKKITLEKSQRAIAICKEVGIDPMASFILGLPGETDETVQKSMEFARRLSPNHGFHILSPFPGTEVREKKDGDRFNEKFKRHIPIIFPLWIIPIVGAGISLIYDFSILMMILLLLFITLAN